MNRWGARNLLGMSILLLAAGGSASSGSAGQQAEPASSSGVSNEREAIGRFVDLYCIACHDRDDKTAGLALDAIGAEEVGRNLEGWERVLRKLDARQMPPEGEVRPSGRKYDAFVSMLAGALDRAAAERPDPGRTDTFRRLNRTEYQNAIRDLLALDIDAAALLPADESSHGFDNVTVGDLSPTRLDRYITAAQKISRLAMGSSGRSPGGETIRIRPDITQEEHVEGLADRDARRGVDRRTRSRRTASTRSRSAWRGTGTSTSRACTSRMSWRCCWIASGRRRSR